MTPETLRLMSRRVQAALDRMPEPPEKAVAALRMLVAALESEFGEVLPKAVDQPNARRVLDVVVLLKQAQRFSPARRLLKAARRYLEDSDYGPPDADDPDKLRQKLRQQQALCTYKDPDKADAPGLREAFAILASPIVDEHGQVIGFEEDLEATRDGETLGIAGAIFKRLGDVEGGEAHWRRAHTYYRRAYEAVPVEQDHGYAAINTAFAADLLVGRIELGEDGVRRTTVESERLRSEADEVRRDVVARLAPIVEQNARAAAEGREERAWWAVASLSEANLGLGRFEAFATLAREFMWAADNAAWQRETFARQTVYLAEVRFGDVARKVSVQHDHSLDHVRNALGLGEHAFVALRLGKVGLALSGGGFRASLFHVGALAALAEADLLRHVQVLSCVSGGSITGALYYAVLKEMLDRKHDPQAADYVEVVQQVAAVLMKGIAKNVRHQAFRWGLGWFNRTDRVAAALQASFFDPLPKPVATTVDLLVSPPGTQHFDPRAENWDRDAKVPVLVLNATTLNTGHNWQFTATWMGEPPGAIEPHIEAEDRLRRVYYGNAPRYRRGVELGVAVGASACVPGVFQPVQVDGLYPEHDVRLVDGGVRENQGLYGLLEQGCDVFLISDGSGQLDDENRPSSLAISTLFRSNDITAKGVRSETFRVVHDRARRPGRTRLVYFHLKSGLEKRKVAWTHAPTTAAREPRRQLTDYGVSETLQLALARVRTDLDRFSDNEMLTLMANGFLLAGAHLEKEGLIKAAADAKAWPFASHVDELANPGRKLEAEIRAGASIFRTWRWLKKRFPRL